MPRTAIYVRLSQEDRGGEADTQSKLQERVNACHTLAHRYNLTVDPADTYIEVMSGSKLSNRPQCRALLAKCESRYYTHIVTAAIDRLTRGDKRDEQTIEEALLRGEITVVTESQVIEFNDDYDERHALPFEVLAAAARQYRRAVIKKAKTAYTQRVREGKYGIGTAPYGYRWVSPATGRKIANGWYEIIGDLVLTKPPPEGHTEESYLELARRQGQPGGALLDGVECVGGQYYWLGIILQMILTHSTHRLAKYLITNDAPIPRARNGKCNDWTESTVLTITKNSFVAGYPSQRRTSDRNGTVQLLPDSKWVYSDNEQSYPHHISIEQHKVIRETLSSRSGSGTAPKTDKTHLLSGIVHCMEGVAMQGSRSNYQCSCYHHMIEHAGSVAKVEKLDNVAKEVIREVLNSLPASVSPLVSNQPPRPTTPRLLPTKRRELADLQKSRDTMVRFGGEEAYTKAEEALISEISELDRQEREARATITEQEGYKQLRALTVIRSVPFNDLWNEMTNEERKQLARAIIKRIDIITPKRRAVRRDLCFTMQSYIEPYYHSRTITVTRAQKE